LAVQKTLSIIKPNAMRKHVLGEILTRFEKAGLSIQAARIDTLSKAIAEGFYAEHRHRPFFGELVEFMTSGPVLLLCLKGEDAVMRNRTLMGATDPAKAEPHTIRKDFGDSIGENAVHGSDSESSAQREIQYFFTGFELSMRD
jgi:nucleoside-diphosphate kinase